MLVSSVYNNSLKSIIIPHGKSLITVKITMGSEWSLGVLHSLWFPNLKKFYEIHYAISEPFFFSSPNKM